MDEQQDRPYRERLGAVLRRRDPAALRDFLVANATRFGDQRQVADVQGKTADELLELMHRMTLARPDLAPLHRDSRQWLFDHGIDSYGSGGGRRN